jgi:hypothetical protein
LGVWDELPTHWSEMGIAPAGWRLVVLVWIVGVTVFVGAAVVGQLGRNRWGRAEGILFLQDDLWRWTRREQRRLHGRLAWLRLRAERKGRK